MLRPRKELRRLEDIVELLQEIGRILMGISAKLDAIVELLRNDEDEEADT